MWRFEMNANQIKAVREKFIEIDEKLADMKRAITWLSLAVISLNKLAEKDHSKEEIEEALKEAAKDLAKMQAAMGGVLTESDSRWDKYLGSFSEKLAGEIPAS
jgi:glyceraldehyde-3-phosphate dehydrogenase/erythrose-4-phosphate dehydrogenase